MGTWLKAFGEAGAVRLVGFDGPWVSPNKMVDDAIDFVSQDLNQLLDDVSERFDLAICLETAEHLRKESSSNVVKNLCALSDVVMFGSACVSQGGTGHINEQKHTWWAELFLEEGYIPYDYFRAEMWGNSAVEFWYQQNTFLYVTSGSRMTELLDQAGHKPIINLDFMNAVHPKLFERCVILAQRRSLIRRSLKQLLPSRVWSRAKKMKEALHFG